MKKITTIIILITVLGLVGCGNSGSKNINTNVPTKLTNSEVVNLVVANSGVVKSRVANSEVIKLEVANLQK